MRRSTLVAGALSVGLLCSQGSSVDLGWGAAQAQDSTDSPKQASPEGKKRPAQPADKPAEKKEATKDAESSANAEAEKAERRAARDKARKDRVAGAAATKESTQETTSPPPAEAMGTLRQRTQPAMTTPVTALDAQLTTVPGKGATPVAMPERSGDADPELKLVPPVVPAPVTSSEAAKDQALRERIQAALLKDPSLSYTARLVSVAVKNGEITLKGQLNTQFERVNVERVVEEQRGYHIVHNQLKVRVRNTTEQ